MQAHKQTEHFVGNFKDESFRGLFKLKYAVDHGIVNNWNDINIIWQHIFTELNVNPEEVRSLHYSNLKINNIN